MLTIDIPEMEQFNAETNEFFTVKAQRLNLEHSLVSISKWESKWKIPFLTKENKTSEQLLDYIRFMTVTPVNVDPNVYLCLTTENVKEIYEYIENPMTATWFSDDKSKRGGPREILTSEVLYYLMISYNIPFECQKWHLNRLLTLIHVCQVKNEPQKKMSKKAIMSRNRALNEARRKRLHSKG